MSENTAKTNAEANMDEEVRTPWQEFVTRQQAAVEHAGKALRGLFPDATVEHWNKALDEFGQGWRALMESVNENVNIKVNIRSNEDGASADGERPSTTGKKKVKIDVE